MTKQILLSGTVGSTAYGLDTPDSDVDRLGIFAWPTKQFFGLTEPKESYVTTNPDQTLHEVRKWIRLALGCNPTAMEIVWLPEDLYETYTRYGVELIELRSKFLSAPRVRDAYLGYATQQFRRLENRGDGSFSADTRKRTAKHARHLARLCAQGSTLYQTGELMIKVSDPEWFHDFGEEVAGGNLDRAKEYLAFTEKVIDQTRTPLPDKPDVSSIEDWLRGLRRELY